MGSLCPAAQKATVHGMKLMLWDVHILVYAGPRNFSGSSKMGLGLIRSYRLQKLKTCNSNYWSYSSRCCHVFTKTENTCSFHMQKFLVTKHDAFLKKLSKSCLQQHGLLSYLYLEWHISLHPPRD